MNATALCNQMNTFFFKKKLYFIPKYSTIELKGGGMHGMAFFQGWSLEEGSSAIRRVLG